MKKSLFAIAAVTAFAGAAQAQSSVTVYGLLDVGYVGGNERASLGSTTAKQTFNTIGQSAQSTSRLGFRGTEDLGGGTSAFFNFETQLQPNAATFSSLQTRAANVGLAQKGIGRATIGTQNTLVTDAISPTITGQFNNIVGSMLFASFTGPTTLGGTSFTASSGNPNGNTDAFTFRTASTLKVQSESIAGFTGSAMLVMNNENDTQGVPTGPTTAQAATGTTITGVTGGKNNQNGWGLGANYTFKKFTATAAYQSFTATNPYTITTNGGTGVATTSPGAPVAYGLAVGTNVKDNQAYVGATYDFGILKAYAGWINRKVTSQIDSNQYAKRTAQEIGVRGNFTPKIEGFASVGNGRVSTFGSSSPTANIMGYQLGTNYLMSKRTNLYAIYGYSGTSTASGTNTSFNASNYAVGVRHTF
jgi:predicted porin